MDTFELNVITPVGRVVQETVIAAEIPTVRGEVGILPNHCDYVVILGTGTLEYSLPSGEKKTLPISEGSGRFVSNTLTILTDRAEV